ncbi:MAG TPA: hypothetical protein VK083_13110 [Nocardia sp.]|uniref:hypothetical protein n=1 Tax=Nocardia sp. TaxID=1821 RepID=UPI002B4AF2C9|nr:hypothetical protein [Nocardia sp.]HLS77720.1 hypothetical protein [Nocardia sp.]
MSNTPCTWYSHAFDRLGEFLRVAHFESQLGGVRLDRLHPEGERQVDTVERVGVERVEGTEFRHAFGHDLALQHPAPQFVLGPQSALQAGRGQAEFRGQDRHDDTGGEIPVRDDRVHPAREFAQPGPAGVEQFVEIVGLGGDQRLVVEQSCRAIPPGTSTVLISARCMSVSAGTNTFFITERG